MLVQGYFKGQRSSLNLKVYLSVSWRNQYALIEWPGGVLNFGLGTDVRPEVSTTTL